MSNYRPKSLNELGNLYDKTLEAENEIKKSSSKLEDKPVQTANAFMPEEDALPMKKTPQQIAADEIADKVDNFAKNFGSTTFEPKKPIVIATVQSKHRTANKKAEEASSDDDKQKTEVDSSKPKLIRNPERTSLFEDYKKVMDDEDDYNFDEPEKEKRKIKKNKPVKPTAPEPVADVQEKDNGEAYDEDELFGSAFNSAPTTDNKSANILQSMSVKPVASSGEKVQDIPVQQENEPEKNPVLQLVLMIMLFCVLLSATGISFVKAFSGANTDKMFFDKCYLYTAKSNYEESLIKKGDLVFVSKGNPAPGDVVAYKQNEGVYAFARYESALNDESVIGNSGGEQVLIFNADLRGVVERSVPFLGMLVLAITEYFFPLIGLLLLLSACLVLLVFFVSKGKNASDDSEEDDGENEQETENEPEDEQEESDDYGYENLDPELFPEGSDDDSEYVQQEGYDEEKEEDDLESLFVF